MKRVVTARGWCRKASLGSTFSLLLSSPCLPLWGLQWHPFHTFQDPMFRHLPFCHQMSLFTLLVNPARSFYGCTISGERPVYVPHSCHMVILNKTLLFVTETNSKLRHLFQCLLAEVIGTHVLYRDHPTHTLLFNSISLFDSSDIGGINQTQKKTQIVILSLSIPLAYWAAVCLTVAQSYG